jgi:hypothetical protein
MLVAWIVFPLVLTLVALGCGLLLELIAGVRLPGVALPAAGLAVVVVATHFTTLSDATAELSAPVVVVLATIGLALSPPWRRGRIDGWAVATAVGVFALYSAPVVLSGEPTFTGYIKLDDTATWLALTDRIMEHGRNLSGLPQSSYEATLAFNIGGGYPIGAFLPLGVGRALVGQDAAWVFQPYMAFLAAMLATTFYAIAAPVLSSRPLRALAAFIASQAALLFGYYLWGGVKEVAAAWTLGLIGVVAIPTLRSRGAVRSVLPLAAASAATLAILSFGGVVWLAPLLLGALVLTLRTYRGAVAVQRAIAFAFAGALFALPSLLKAKQFLSPNTGTLTRSNDLGNLVEPLDWRQFFGIWPTGDFRFEPESIDATNLLIVLVAVAALLGLVFAWRRRANGFLIYVVGATAGCFLIVAFGSAWIDAKALATASPAFILAGLVAGGAMAESGRRIEGAVVIAVIAGGVLWSNALAYKDVTLAPHERLAELEDIGSRFAGQGPALMTDYEPYGVRHFLRRLDPEGASELRRRVIPLRSGRPLDKLEVADIDQFQLDGLLVYRTIVLRTSPVESRPPSPYRLIRPGRYYDVWQRSEAPAPVVEHLPLGDSVDPTAPAPCDDVLRLAREAGPGGRLAAAVRSSSPIVIDLSSATRPMDWQAAPGVSGAVSPTSPGKVSTFVHVPVTGRYSIWVGGAFRRKLDVLVDGKQVATRRDELSHTGQYEPLGETPLSMGVHRVALRYGKADLHPGSGDPPFALGPLVLARPPRTTVRLVPRPDARSLCGKRLDWVEALTVA